MMRWLTMLLVGCLLANQGCTYRAWYEGFQKKQRNDCYQYQNQKDVQECLDKSNMTYDEYEKTRKNPKK